MNHRASDISNSLPQRVLRFFRDQLAWHEQVLDDLSRLPRRLELDDFEALETQRSLFTRDIARMQDQQEALLREWQQASKPPAPVLEEIRALAREAESMASRVANELELASQIASAKADSVRVSLVNLRKGRKAFTGYRQDAYDPGFIDERL